MANGADIAKAYVQIIPTTKGIKAELDKQLGKAAGESGGKAGETSGGSFLSKLGGTLAKGASVVGKGALVAAKGIGIGLAAAAPAVAALAKGAISAYADYEQLVGGVETLFKTSADEVQKYADNAYKTSGLSANEYMETVTSFSASLLQSLDGDTAAAAAAADLAVTDMADNANKMGTSMESIQNAYQGFAKQNYTMLDNLKLGYGGTKSEMERLLADATAISGVEYDIDSLNDVYSAIHVIQTELGITGTTAKEASTTISGSLASLKASWKNVLVGIADENANFGSLVNGLVESAGTFAANIMPRISQALQGVGQLVTGLAPVIVAALPSLIESVLPGLLQAGMGIVSALVESLPSLINTVITALVGFLVASGPQLVEGVLQLMTALPIGMAESLPTLIPAAVEAVLTIVEGLIDNIGMLVDAAISIIVALAEGLIAALPRLIEKAPEIISKLVTALIQNVPKLLQAAGEVITTLVKGIVQNFPKLVQSAGQILMTIKNGIVSGVSQLISAGRNLVEGIWQGISNSLSWIKQKITGWVGNVVSFIKNLFGIHSPSTVMRDQVGRFLALGIGEGFTDTMPSVEKDMLDAMPDFGGMNARFTAPAVTHRSIGDVSITVNGTGKNAEQIARELQAIIMRKEALYA